MQYETHLGIEIFRTGESLSDDAGLEDYELQKVSFSKGDFDDSMVVARYYWFDELHERLKQKEWS